MQGLRQLTAEPPPPPGPDPGRPPPDRPEFAWPAGSGAGPGYPHQQLSEQHVQAGHSKRPWVLGIVGLVVAVLVGVALWIVFGPDGEETRAEYCAALRDATDNGDLLGVLGSADEETVAAFREVADLAPDAVAGDWDTLVEIADDPSSVTDGDVLGTAMDAFGAVRSIARDAADECDLDIGIPLE